MDGLNLVGKVINERYELQEIIGCGGMAVVYKGFDRLMNRFVAFKLLKESLKYDDEIVEKFSAEAKASAGLSHQNIITIYDVGQYEGLGFIVMEYIDGKTLKEYINENKPVKWQTACEIAIQIADALSIAHEHGIIHRDIKPHNILINKENVAKVADFGIARAVSSETVVAGGSALGSVYYISPEQARGGYVDATSDIYALGVVLYEMLTGALPIDGDNAVSIALKKLEEEPVNPKVINLDIPQELDAIVMRAIAREQHLRYKTVNEFMADLKELLNGDSMHIIPSKIANEPEKKKNRKKSSNSFNPIIASFVLIVLLAIGTFLLVNSGGKEYIVPDLMGLTLEEAVEKVEGTEFTIDEEAILYEVSEEHEEGKIFNQDPGANQSVKKNKKIKLKISSGATEGNIIVPKVLDADVNLAKELLDAKKLSYQIIESEGEEAQLNKVIKQTPQDGTKVSEGYTVILHVCTKVFENSEVEVPSLNGLTRSQAEKELKEFGLALGNTKKEFSDKEKGTVISQSPKSGDTVTRGTSVDIVISDGKEVQTEQTPENNPPSTGTQQGEMKRKTLTISIPESAKDPAQIRVLANGKEIHNQSHSKSEGKVDILVQSQKDAEVEVYIDGELMVHKVIEFN